MSSAWAKRAVVSRWSPWLLAALVCLGCATTLRLPPGGVRPARIAVGVPGGARVLALQHTASDCGGYTAAATSHEELDALWSDFALPEPVPDVDFGADVVVA